MPLPFTASSVDDPWTQAMRQGDFAGAWAISDGVLTQRQRSRQVCWNWPRHQQFIWNGDSLAGKRVLVRCYHGLGDTIQFARLLVPLQCIASAVIVWIQPVLIPLLSTLQDVELLPLHDGVPEVDYDIDIELMELAHALRVELQYDPDGHAQLSVKLGEAQPRRRLDAPPYIYVSPAEHISTARDERLRVGLVWRAGDWDPGRSLMSADLSELRALSNVHWHSLQYPPEKAMPLPMEDLACHDLQLMAQRMRNLDLILSVDTMAAHLAGALAVPVWTMLRRDCDWRWLQSRRDSPWYPTMRLFRQIHDGEWRSVIAQVRAALESHRRE